MAAVEKLVTQHLDLWATAIKRRSAAGRGSSSKVELYGIKKLRELILELAVRGVLVPQDPQDEPASELLKRISEEKAGLVKAGKIGKEQPLPPVSNEEMPFTLPINWCWVRLGEVTNYGLCDKAEASDVDQTTWVLELEDVEKETSRLLQKIRFADRAFKSSKNIFKAGDVIYGKLRPYLDKVLVADEDGVCTTEMIPVRAHAVITPAFLRLSMKTPRFISYANSATHGMNLPRVGTEKARLALIPLCSEITQNRIVAKVDELMALCDQLEQQTEASLGAHQTLVATLLNALTSAVDHAQFASSWQRIAEHFDTLFKTEESIDQLKQTILQLAVMGKLVPQDPNDEPASELLKKIADEKARLVKSGQIRKEKPVPPVGIEEEPFALPQGWQWARLTEVAAVIDPNPSHRMPTYVEVGIPFISTENFVGADRIDFSIGKKVAPSVLAEQVGKFDIKKGAFAISRIGTIGKTRFLPLERNYCMSHALCVISPYLDVFSHDYLRFVVSAESSLSQAHEGVQSIGVPDLGVGVIRGLLLPIPPLGLQHRIVAKVDELMALCDQLKAKLAEAQTTQLHLADALAEQALLEA